MRISKHLAFKEVVHSNTAKREDIDNTPNDNQLLNIIYWARNIFEPLREWVGGPVKVNSVFRSRELNKKINGSSTTHHLCNDSFAAGDLDDTYSHKSNAEMFHFIKDNLPYEELIAEFYDQDSGGPRWIHVSADSTGNATKETLIAIKVIENGRKKTKYKPYSDELWNEIYTYQV